MNEIVNVILTSFHERDRLDRLNQILSPKGGIGLINIADKRDASPWYGGEKNLEVDICLGAFKDLDLDRIIAAMREIDWGDPEWVQLFVCRGSDQRFIEVAWRELPGGACTETSSSDE